MKIKVSLPAIALITATTLCGTSLAQTSPAPTPAPAPSPPSRSYRPTPALDFFHESRRRDELSILALSARPASANTQYVQAYDFARCAANVSPSLSSQFLAKDAGSVESAILSRQLRGISKGCVPAGTYVYPTFLRGAIAETLYRRAARTGGVNVSSTSSRPKSVASFSQCLFAQSPTTVDTLLRSTPATSEEQQAFSRLAGFASKCVVAGRPVATADAMQVMPLLRGELAEQAYKALEPAADTVG